MLILPETSLVSRGHRMLTSDSPRSRSVHRLHWVGGAFRELFNLASWGEKDPWPPQYELKPFFSPNPNGWACGAQCPSGENGPLHPGARSCVWGNVSSPGLNPPSYAPQAHALPTRFPEHVPAGRSGWEWGEEGTESGLLCTLLTPNPFSTYGLQ